MIRAFITTWSGVKGGTVSNPIIDYVDTLPNMGIICSMHYPDTDADGLPDKPRVLVIVEGPPAIENLNNLAGVKMLPAYRFSKPISEIPQNVIDTVKSAIVNEGIPLSALSGIVVYGDFLKKIARYFNASHAGFGRYETVNDLDFE